jgi:hypothetical protein
VSTQLDLFEKPAPTTRMVLATTLQAKVVGQLQALLIEAMAVQANRLEAGDDQDQA